jgi:hypothetical protein
MNTLLVICIALASLFTLSVVAEAVRRQAPNSRSHLLRFLESVRADLAHEEPSFVHDKPDLIDGSPAGSNRPAGTQQKTPC